MAKSELSASMRKGLVRLGEMRTGVEVTGSGAEVDLRVVLVQPGESEYHALFTEAGDCKQNALGVSFIGHDHVDDFADASGLVKRSVHVVNRDRLGQFAGRKFFSGDEVLVDEVSGSAGIDHGLCGCFFHSVCHL